MTREAISLTIPDISAFAKALRREAGDDDTGHQAWLNRIARAAGYRNFQHLSATRKGAEPPADARAVARALRWFDDRGRMTAWPSKTGVQKLCLWGLWARLPRGLSMTEREVSAAIDEWSTFGDAAIIRRTLVEMRLLDRTTDGSVYTRVERRPGPEARALIRALTQAAAQDQAG